MSLLKSVQGLIAIGNALGITRPIFMGGKDCSGNAVGLPICTSTPEEGSLAIPFTPRPVKVFRDSFSGVMSTINSNWDVISLGAGQTIAQAGGNLVMTSGVTPNEEIIVRTKVSWKDSLVLRYLLTNSAYQANAKSTVELVDVLGDNLALTSSGTAVSITKPTGHGFTSENIGQSLFIGAFKNHIGGGVIVPGQWAIASITNANTFVVTATGSTGDVTSGTCSVWGWNSLRVQYGATTTSTAYLNSTRRGWNSAVDTSVSTNTITSGSYGMWSVNDGVFVFNETTNNNTSALSNRGGRTTGTPGSDVDLYLQIRLTVGTSAPTAITTTIGMVSVEDINVMPTDMTMNRGTASGANSQPVSVTNTIIANANIQSPSVTQNGVNTFALINSANSTNLTSAKSSNTSITSIQLFNNGATPAYFKVYNKSSAPVLASDTPIFIVGLGAGQGFSLGLTHHLRMNSGFAYAITGGAANTDATAVAVNQVVGGVQYA